MTILIEMAYASVFNTEETGTRLTLEQRSTKCAKHDYALMHLLAYYISNVKGSKRRSLDNSEDVIRGEVLQRLQMFE